MAKPWWNEETWTADDVDVLGNTYGNGNHEGHEPTCALVAVLRKAGILP